MLRPTRAILATLVFLQTTPLPAQTVHEFAGQQVSSPWQASQGAFGRSVSGRLSHNPIPDVVVLCGSTPVLMADADPRDCRLALSVNALDIDVLPKAGWGGFDALASVGAGGLSLTCFEPASQSFATTLIAAGPWAGARLVRALDLDGNGIEDLVGLRSDGLTLVSLLASAAGGPFTTGPQCTASAPVRDLCAVRWDADPARELALLTDLRVEVLEGDGTLRDSWNALLPGGALARLSQTGTSTDRLAWITAYAPPAQQLLMTLAPGGAIHDAVVLGALDAFSARGGDYDLDGDDDLLVSHHYSNELIWFENLRTPQTPAASSFQSPDQQLTLFRVGPPGQSAVLNQATPVSADLDGDGDLDVLFACQTSQSLELLRGEAVDEEARKPQLSAATWKPDLGALALTVQKPATIPSGATHVQLIVWRRTNLTAAFLPVPQYHVLAEISAGATQGLSVPLPETTPEFAAIYCLELRMVRVGAGGAILESFAASIADFATDDPTVEALLSSPGVLGALVVATETPIPETHGTAKIIRRPRTQVFGSGFVPYI